MIFSFADLFYWYFYCLCAGVLVFIHMNSGTYIGMYVCGGQRTTLTVGIHLLPWDKFLFHHWTVYSKLPGLQVLGHSPVSFYPATGPLRLQTQIFMWVPRIQIHVLLSLWWAFY